MSTPLRLWETPTPFLGGRTGFLSTAPTLSLSQASRLLLVPSGRIVSPWSQRVLMLLVNGLEVIIGALISAA